MSIDWRNFAVFFLVGIILISVAAVIPLYPQSIISELQNNLSSGSLSQSETYAQQGSLTWWKLAQKQTYEPLSSIINLAGLLTLVLSVMYACFALWYNLSQNKLKGEKDFSCEITGIKETLTDNSVSQPEVPGNNSNSEHENKKNDSTVTSVVEDEKSESLEEMYEERIRKLKER